jgi:tetratricopeptide (TPR) repeat protein
MISPSLHCNSCGAANRPQSRYCVSCGKPLQATQIAVQTSAVASFSKVSAAFFLYQGLLARVHNTRGDILLDLKRYTKTLATFNHAIQLNPNLAAIYNAKGNTLSKLQRYQEALAAFDHAIQLNPHLAIAHHNKGLALEHLGRSKAAQQTYERAKQLGYSG